ncbi:cytochrome c oxidase accessory protein CcoG [Sandarakinorhabdus sp. AAP62]|uniref:cytochrome c oxidase accessory protein CcoG n=1 Tax=Sandarakinorhabdus sp. AAP62 TaxID=1248916 RepID=UPI0002D6AE72|nr:cytochrome c oxidase accessory protein CcoG [Sandarakinorhabdus sp. AAP62]
MSALDLINPTSGLYRKREPVFPRVVKGRFRQLKWAVMLLCLAVYYITPWIRWDRGAYAPDQAVLVDLANRRFFMFDIEIWPQEFYYVAGLLIMAGIGLFLVTSAVGRAWCGYACPQTVWTDLFQHVERWIDGDRNAQLKLNNAPWSAAKLGRRLTKWSIWLVIAMATGGAWIFYFADAPTLAGQFLSGDAPFVAYSTVGVLTATTFIFGGFMREQVCIYMCPWPRIQTAMLDEKSLIVTYRDWRGEPRTQGVKKAAAAGEKVGDCIDCNACVSVCPTGVDIRQGPQLGCINCALCIDACDEVMGKLNRPRGLIDYLNLDDEKHERAGGAARPILKTLLRPRTLIYFAIWASIGLAMLFTLGERARLTIDSAQDRNPVVVTMSDGQVRNGWTIKLRNMESRPRSVELTMAGLPQGRMWTDAMDRKDAARSVRLNLAADATTRLHLYVAAPAGPAGETPFALVARPLDAPLNNASGTNDGREAARDIKFIRQ